MGTIAKDGTKGVLKKVYLSEEQARELELLHRRTRRAKADLIREAVDLVIDKHKKEQR